jgi:hypothetical protein
VNSVHVLPVEVVRHGRRHPVAVEVLSAHHSWFSFSLTVGDLIVGVGTLALAGFTAWLGFSTRASATATQVAVEASEEPFVIATPTSDWAAIKNHPGEPPVLVGTPPPSDINRVTATDGSFVRLKLWNIGHGPAIAVLVHLLDGDNAALLDPLHQDYALPAGGFADIEIPSPKWVPLPGEGELIIYYTHADGRLYVTKSDVDIDGPIVNCKTYERIPPQSIRIGRSAELLARIKRLVAPGTQRSR